MRTNKYILGELKPIGDNPKMLFGDTVEEGRVNDVLSKEKDKTLQKIALQQLYGQDANFDDDDVKKLNSIGEGEGWKSDFANKLFQYFNKFTNQMQPYQHEEGKTKSSFLKDIPPVDPLTFVSPKETMEKLFSKENLPEGKAPLWRKYNITFIGDNALTDMKESFNLIPDKLKRETGMTYGRNGEAGVDFFVGKHPKVRDLLTGGNLGEVDILRKDLKNANSWFDIHSHPTADHHESKFPYSDVDPTHPSPADREGSRFSNRSFITNERGGVRKYGADEAKDEKINLPSGQGGKGDELMKVLSTNKNKNFVKRILYREKYPSIDNGDGSFSTHKMAYSDDGNGNYYVYPTIVQENSGKLKELNNKDAYDYARENNEFIKFNNVNDAKSFSENYKEVWDLPRGQGGKGDEPKNKFIKGKLKPITSIKNDEPKKEIATSTTPKGKELESDRTILQDIQSIFTDPDRSKADETPEKFKELFQTDISKEPVKDITGKDAPQGQLHNPEEEKGFFETAIKEPDEKIKQGFEKINNKNVLGGSLDIVNGIIAGTALPFTALDFTIRNLPMATDILTDMLEIPSIGNIGADILGSPGKLVQQTYPFIKGSVESKISGQISDIIKYRYGVEGGDYPEADELAQNLLTLGAYGGVLGLKGKSLSEIKTHIENGKVYETLAKDKVKLQEEFEKAETVEERIKTLNTIDKLTQKQEQYKEKLKSSQPKDTKYKKEIAKTEEKIYDSENKVEIPLEKDLNYFSGVKNGNPELVSSTLGKGSQPTELVYNPKTGKIPVVETKGVDVVETPKSETTEKYRIGRSPQTYTITEKLPFDPKRDLEGEVYVKVKNDKTGVEEVVLETDLKPVKTTLTEIKDPESETVKPEAGKIPVPETKAVEEVATKEVVEGGKIKKGSEQIESNLSSETVRNIKFNAKLKNKIETLQKELERGSERTNIYDEIQKLRKRKREIDPRDNEQYLKSLLPELKKKSSPEKTDVPFKEQKTNLLEQLDTARDILFSPDEIKSIEEIGATRETIKSILEKNGKDNTKALKDAGFKINTENNAVKIDILGDGTITIPIESIHQMRENVQKKYPISEGYSPKSNFDKDTVRGSRDTKKEYIEKYLEDDALNYKEAVKSKNDKLAKSLLENIKKVNVKDIPSELKQKIAKELEGTPYHKEYLSQKQSKRIISEESYQKAKSELGKLPDTTNALPVDWYAKNVKNLTTVGLYHFENGARNFKDFSERVIKEFGDKVKPHIEELWKIIQNENDLIARHNVWQEKLKFADELGGFANPSLAITKKGMPFENFGDVTLVPDKSMIDPALKRSKTFGADVYSPRFPTIDATFDLKKFEALNDEVYKSYIKYHKQPEWRGKNALDTEAFERYDKSGLKRNEYMEIYFLDEIIKDKNANYKSREGVRNSIKKHNDEYNKFIDKVFDDLTIEKRIFKGFTDSGNRRYSPLTLENLSKELRKDIRGGENFSYGVGSLRAKVTPEFKRISEMSKAKDTLVNSEKFEKIKDEINNEMFEVMETFADSNSDRMGRADDFLNIIGDAISSRKNIVKELEEYGFTDGNIPMLNDFLSKLRSFPTEYFETRMLQPVRIGEFKTALVPENASKQTLDIFRRYGFKDVRKYKDQADRQRIIEELEHNFGAKEIKDVNYREALRKVKEQSFIPESAKALFRTRGKLPEKLHSQLEQLRANQRANELEAKTNALDLRRAMTREYGRGSLQDKQLTESLYDYLTGKDINVKPETKKMLDNLRKNIDKYSQDLLNTPLLSTELQKIIGDNMGQYLTRFYERDLNKKWKNFIQNNPEGQRIYNTAKNYLEKKNPKLSQEEIAGQLEVLMQPAQDFFKADFSKGSETKIDRGTLKQRKNIPPELKDLMGEIKDPVANYTRSVFKMGNMIEKASFLDNMRTEGFGEYLYDKPIKNSKGNFTYKLASGDNPAYKPLTQGKDIYTSKEIKEALEEAFTEKETNPAVKIYQQLMGLTRYGKTALSPVTTMRNILSNPVMMLANGYRNFHEVGHGITISKRQNRAYRDKLTRLGVIGNSANLGELKATTTDIFRQPSEVMRTSRNTFRRGKELFDKPGEFYGAIDDVFKVQAFEKEMARHKKAFKEELDNGTMTIPELEKMVADKVTDVLPTYSKVPPIIKKYIRRLPIGNFVSFPAEVMRTMYNIPKIALKEIRNPKTRSIGVDRLSSYIGTLSAVSSLPMISKMLTGVTDEEENAIRNMLPEWQKNSQFFHTGKDANGNYDFYDLSYTDPYNYIKKPLIALMTSENSIEGVSEGLQELFSPFVSEEILAKAIMDIRSNKDSDKDKPIYNEEDTSSNKFYNVMEFLLSKVSPGGVTFGQRLYKSANNEKTANKRYDLNNELMGLTGQRKTKFNIEDALKFKTIDFKKEIDEINSMSNTAQHKYSEDEDKLNSRLKEVNTILDNKYETIRGFIKDIRTLGGTDQQIDIALKNAGISKKQIASILKNKDIDISDKSELIKLNKILNDAGISDYQLKDTQEYSESTDGKINKKRLAEVLANKREKIEKENIDAKYKADKLEALMKIEKEFDVTLQNKSSKKTFNLK